MKKLLSKLRALWDRIEAWWECKGREAKEFHDDNEWDNHKDARK